MLRTPNVCEKPSKSFAESLRQVIFFSATFPVRPRPHKRGQNDPFRCLARPLQDGSGRFALIEGSRFLSTLIPYRLILLLSEVAFIPSKRAARLWLPPAVIRALRMSCASKRLTSVCRFN